MTDNETPILGGAYQPVWDFIAKDLDPDIREAFEKKYRERLSDSPMPAFHYINSPHLTALTLQLVRELKKSHDKRNG